MKILQANLWDSTDDLILVTTNSYLGHNGLAMGRGAASEFKHRYPELQKEFSEIVRGSCGHLGKYGIVWKEIMPQSFGIFQVKYHFKDRANLELIKYSTEILNNMAKNFMLFSMNFPGIGYGGLSMKEVLPIVETLPDNVTLYIKDGVQH